MELTISTLSCSNESVSTGEMQHPKGWCMEPGGWSIKVELGSTNSTGLPVLFQGLPPGSLSKQSVELSLSQSHGHAHGLVSKSHACAAFSTVIHCTPNKKPAGNLFPWTGRDPSQCQIREFEHQSWHLILSNAEQQQWWWHRKCPPPHQQLQRQTGGPWPVLWGLCSVILSGGDSSPTNIRAVRRLAARVDTMEGEGSSIHRWCLHPMINCQLLWQMSFQSLSPTSKKRC